MTLHEVLKHKKTNNSSTPLLLLRWGCEEGSAWADTGAGAPIGVILNSVGNLITIPYPIGKKNKKNYTEIV